VVGPLIAVLFVAFWQIFSREFNPHTRDLPEEDGAAEAGDSDGRELTG
jgi:hypothetical protein